MARLPQPVPGEVRDAGPYLYEVVEPRSQGWWWIDTRPSSAGGLHTRPGKRIVRRRTDIMRDRLVTPAP
jgi:hypothetical protein